MGCSSSSLSGSGIAEGENRKGVVEKPNAQDEVDVNEVSDDSKKTKVVVDAPTLLCISTSLLEKVCEQFVLCIPRVVINQLFMYSHSKDVNTKQKAILMRHWLLTKNMNGNTVVIVQSKHIQTKDKKIIESSKVLQETLEYIQELTQEGGEYRVITVSDDDSLRTQLESIQFPQKNIWSAAKLQGRFISV